MHAHSHVTWAALTTGFFAWILPARCIGAVGRGERLTTSGGHLARWAPGASRFPRRRGVTVAASALRGLSSGPARRFGHPLPGIGDEAWLVNRNRTLVMRVGALTAKITIGAQGFADTYSVLTGLAPTLAARLAEYDT